MARYDLTDAEWIIIHPLLPKPWRGRPVSKRQRQAMVLLAHIREQYHHSLGSYGRPRMTQELKELGLSVGHRRVGRLMRQNGLRVVRTRR